MIELQGVTKVYVAPDGRPHRALDEVSFQARPGRVTALLGRNGAGKTTALRIVSTILAPAAGSARVLGHDTRREPSQVRRALGFLSPSIGLFDRFTPAELIEFFAEMHGLGREQRARRRAELTAQLELGEFLDQVCATLSSGQRQRVQLARALVHEPQVVVLDEPTVGLDVVVAHGLRRAIERLRGPERTVLLSTHSFNEVEQLADDVVVLDHGRVVADGTLAALKGEHPTLEAAFFALIGTGDPA